MPLLEGIGKIIRNVMAAAMAVAKVKKARLIVIDAVKAMISIVLVH